MFHLASDPAFPDQTLRNASSEISPPTSGVSPVVEVHTMHVITQSRTRRQTVHRHHIIEGANP